MMTTAQSLSAERKRRRQSLGRALLAVSGIAIALAGCKTNIDRHEITGSVPEDYRTVHPISIEEAVETLDIPVGLNSERLPGAVKSNIEAFARGYRASGSATIAIVSPSGSPNETIAAYMSYAIADVLIGSGVSPKAIDHRVYKAGPTENSAPVRMAYARIAARTAPCGPWPDQVAKTGQNKNYYAFGCASQRNLAAMVDNPLDLLYPRGMSPPDATRRATVLEKYQKGEIYQTDYSREPGGRISQGVGQ
jgi:pilus assembly protein CpaD